MKISNKGLIEIMSHEGVCLSPYLDSVGVWTIGVGITKYDGKDPREFGNITIDQAIQMFKDRIPAYEAPVQKLDLTLTQYQYDALVSLCYNFGPGNLQKLCKGRTVNAIGTAIMLYTKPPEITKRRQKEQQLYQYGKYSSGGKVLVFPVSANHHPIYGKGYQLDVSKYFSGEPVGPTQTIVKKADPEAAAKAQESAQASNPILDWLKNH